MLRGSRGRLAEALLALGVLAVALAVLAASAQRVAWHQDEGLTLYSARYFNYLFLQRDLGRAEWGDNHWTMTQPMLARYLVGAAIWARGYDFARLEDYNFHRRFTANRERGVLPADAQLLDIRAPMVALGAAAILLLFLLGRLLGGPIAGLGAAALGLGSPLAQEWLVRAKGEAPLVCLLLLALLLAVLGARRGREGALPWAWALALGLALGLALQAKLTAALSLAATLTWGVCLAATARAHGRRAWPALRGWLLAVALALGVFVLTDPYLYPDPVGRAVQLVQHRQDEMAEQERQDPDRAVPSLPRQAAIVLHGSLVGSTFSGSRGIPLEAGLVVVGLGALLLRCRAGWRRTGWVPAVEGWVGLTTLAYFAGISVGMRFAEQRYYLPALLLGTLLSGLGAATIVGQVRALAARRFGRRAVRSDAPAAS